MAYGIGAGPEVLLACVVGLATEPPGDAHTVVKAVITGALAGGLWEGRRRAVINAWARGTGDFE